MTLFNDQPKRRKRDKVFEAICALWYPTLDVSKISKTIRGRINEAAKSLRAYSDFSIDEMRTRRERMVLAKGDDWDTPMALAKHWPKFATAKTLAPNSASEKEIEQRRREEAERAARLRQEAADMEAAVVWLNQQPNADELRKSHLDREMSRNLRWAAHLADNPGALALAIWRER
jgi:hypothetical protein